MLWKYSGLGIYKCTLKFQYLKIIYRPPIEIVLLKFCSIAFVAFFMMEDNFTAMINVLYQINILKTSAFLWMKIFSCG